MSLRALGRQFTVFGKDVVQAVKSANERSKEEERQKWQDAPLESEGSEKLKFE